MNVSLPRRHIDRFLLEIEGKTDFSSLLRHLASSCPRECAVKIARGDVVSQLTYAELWHRAVAAAAVICGVSEFGDRILLPIQTSVEFIEAFFGCLVSGRIAVPLPVEKKGSRFSRVSSVIEDCGASVAFFRSRLDLEQMSDATAGLRRFAIEETGWEAKTDIELPNITADMPAFIQYTSGSTSTPKGVVITHGNVMSNANMIRRGMSLSESDRVISWLPVHHDLGLMGMLLAPLAVRAKPFLYPPEDFAKDPMSWLRFVDEQRGTLTGAPNFAFDLIARKAQDTKLRELDLSCLRLLYCGSERIAERTIRRFYDRLSVTGLCTRSFFVCYGMAEASVYVTGAFKDAALPLSPVETSEYPSCGRLAEGLSLRLRSENAEVASGHVGEIELFGPSVSPGYWREFSEQVSTTSDRLGWLKTGDLGFVSGDELVVTGRIKDIVKVRGRNVYPEDLEGPLEVQAGARLPANGVVVAATTDEVGHEVLTVFVEIGRSHRKGPFDELFAEFQSVLGDLDIRCERFVVLAPLTMPKTSSGKKQRRRTAELLQQGLLTVLWDSADTSLGPVIDDSRRSEPPGPEERDVDLAKLTRYFGSLDMSLADERRSFPCDFLKTLQECSLMAMLVPKQYGGLGVSHARFAEIGEALGYIDLSLAAMVGVQNTIGLLPVLWSDVLPDREAVLRAVAGRGDAVAFALTEPDSPGSHPRAITSTVVSSDKGLILTGEKIWIGNATFASFIVVLAHEVDSNGHAVGISAFLLRRGGHDYRVAGEQLTLGVRSMPQARLSFDNVHLSEHDRLTKPGQGMALAYRAMEYARFGLASVALGGLRSALSHAWDHAATREIATGPLLENYWFKVDLGEALLDLESLRATVDLAACHLEQTGELPQSLSLACKILAGEVGFKGTDRALQCTGGRGYTEPLGLARIWRDMRVLRIFEGPTETVAAHLGALVERRTDAVAEALALTVGSAHPVIAEATRLVRTAVDVYARRQDEQAFAVELGLLTSRLIAFAALLGSSRCNESIRATAEARMRSLSRSFERRMGELKGLEDAFHRLSGCLREEARMPRGETRLYDCWPNGATMTRPAAISLSVSTRPTTAMSQSGEAALETTAAFQDDILKRLTDWISKASKTRVVDVDRPVAFYGIDSLLAFELHCFVEEAFRVRLPDSVFSEDLSIRRLAECIEGGGA